MHFTPIRLGSPRRARGPLLFGLAAASVLAGVALAAVLSLPHVTAIYPAPGAAQVSSRTPIRITFNRAMNPASLEQTVRVNLPYSGTQIWEDHQLIFTPAQPWPEKSVITVTLAGGQSAGGLPLLEQRTWSFTVAGQRLAYLTGATPNLWLLPLEAGVGAEPYTITAEAEGIYNFDISPDGTRTIYAALRADGGADLRMMNLDGTDARQVLACPGQACLSPVFSPDGTYIAYERQEVMSDTLTGATFGDSHVYLYTLATGVDERVDTPAPDARFPRWGTDGRLTFFDTDRRAIVVRDVTNGAVTYVPNGTGDVGTWSPDAQFLVHSEIVLPAQSQALPGEDFADHFYSHLYRVSVATNQALDLSGDTALVTDGSPVFSPSGEWLVFGRRNLTPQLWTLGRQIWLMRVDGSEPHVLTNEPTYQHSAFVWSPDETALVYMRFNAGDPAALAEIWMMDRDGANAHRLVTGYLPEWVP